MVFIFIVAILFIFFCIYMIVTLTKKRKKCYEDFIRENKVVVTKKSEPFHDGKSLIWDEDKDYIWVYVPLAKKQIGFKTSDITGCELKVDDETHFKTSLKSTAGRAIVGGVLAGGVGAIIGGITGKKKGNTLIKNVELILTTIDLNNPYVKITAFKNQKGVNPNSLLFKAQLENATYWCKFTEALVERQNAPTI